jgi:branched-chain amino acid transport system substrate-binding protein
MFNFKTLAHTAAVLLVAAFSATTVAAQETIRLGMLQMLTGDLAKYGIPLRDAALFAVDEINAKGGINGRQIEVFLEDVGSTPGGSVQAALRLIQRDNVQVIMQGGTSGHTLATIPLVDEHGVAMANMSTSEAITQQGSKWTFRAARVPNSILDRTYADYVVRELGLKRIAIIYGNDEMGQDASRTFMGRLKELGVEPIAVEQLQVGDPDVSAQVTRIKAANPEAIFVQGHTNETSKIIRTIRQLILDDVLLLGFDQMTTDDFIELAGGCGNVAGMLFRTGILGERSANQSLHDFIARWKAQSDVDPFLPMIQYAGMQVVFEALRIAGGDLSRKNIRDSFLKVQGFNTIFGTISVQPNGETMSIAHIMKFSDDCTQEIVAENYQ